MRLKLLRVATAFATDSLIKLATEKGELTLQNLFDVYVERHAQKTCKTWREMIEQFDRSFDGDVKDRSRAVTVDLRLDRQGNLNSSTAIRRFSKH